MVIQMTSQECIAALRREGGALAHAARQDPTRPVPYYPGWSVAELVAHTGAVHRWVLGIVRSRATERMPREPHEERDPVRLLAWFEEGLAALAGELEGRRSERAGVELRGGPNGGVLAAPHGPRHGDPPLGRAERIR